MDELLSRVWEDMGGRIHGPMSFRFILQPVMATLFAMRDGVRDARAGRPAYLWALFTDPANRGSRLRDGWKSVSRIFVLAVLMDVIYEWLVFRRFYPGETLLVSLLLAAVPYALMRGPAKRFAELWTRRGIVSKASH